MPLGFDDLPDVTGRKGLGGTGFDDLPETPGPGTWESIKRIPTRVGASMAATVAGLKATPHTQIIEAYPEDGNVPESGQLAYESAVEALRHELSIIEAAQEDMAPLPGEGMFTRSLGNAAVSTPAMLAALAVGAGTRNPYLAAATMYPTTKALTSGDLMSEYIGELDELSLETGQPITPQQYGEATSRANLHGSVQGAIEAGTEMLPFKAVLKPGSPLLRRFTDFMAQEIPGESIATITQTIDDVIARSPEGVTVEELLTGLEQGGMQLPETWMTTAIMGGPTTLAAHSLAPKEPELELSGDDLGRLGDILGGAGQQMPPDGPQTPPQGPTGFEDLPPALPAPTVNVDSTGRAGTTSERAAIADELGITPGSQQAARDFEQNVDRMGPPRPPLVPIADEATEPAAVPVPVTPDALAPEEDFEFGNENRPSPGNIDAETAEILRGMGERAGWAERGGQVIRRLESEDESSRGLIGAGQGDVVGRTQWLPKDDWWPGRPGAYNEDQTRAIIEKGIAGQRLGPRQREYFDYLVETADEFRAGADILPTPEELADIGFETDNDAAADIGLTSRAMEIDEDAVERASIQFADDDAGFLNALNEIVRGQRPAGQTGRSGAEAAGNAQGSRLADEVAPDSSVEQPGRRYPRDTRTGDLFGDDTRQQQSLSDEIIGRDEQRNAGQESPETGDPSDLFSQAQRQTDLVAPVSQMFVEWGGRRFPVESIDDAQDKWDQFREASNAGASEIGGAIVTDESGKKLGKIAYNGRYFPEQSDADPAPSVREDRQDVMPQQEERERSTGNIESTDQRSSGDNFGAFMDKALKRYAMELQGQDILDDMTEAGISPQDVAAEFWKQTYPQLNGQTQGRFRNYLRSLSGMEIGSVLGTEAGGEKIVANDWFDLADFINDDLPQDAGGLEGIDRGYVAMMAWANQQRRQQQAGDNSEVPSIEERRANYGPGLRSIEGGRRSEDPPTGEHITLEGETIQRETVPVEESTQATPPKLRDVNRSNQVEDRAFHGSHAKFDRFNLSHIGSGEGAQAFGWGVYLAQERNTAKSYSPRDFDMEEELLKLYNAAQYRFDQPAMEVLESAMTHETMSEIEERYSDENYDDERAQYDAAIESIRPLLDDAKTYLYTVDVPDDVVADMLDYDAEPTEGGRDSERLMQFAEEHPDIDVDEMRDALGLSDGYRGQPESIGTIYGLIASSLGGPKEASIALAEAGIPGIKYLDQASRTAEGGTYNYVVFDDSILTITERNGKPVSDSVREQIIDKSSGGVIEQSGDDQSPIKNQLDLFLSNPPVQSQKGAPRLDQARRDAVEAVHALARSGSLLGRRAARAFAKAHSITLEGEKIASPIDLATAGQIYRDNRFETFRLFFVDKNDKVISQVSMGSRLPASASAFIGENFTSFVFDVATRAATQGATGMWMFHNHPSGSSKPSGADYGVTENYKRVLSASVKLPSSPSAMKFHGHVVVDTNNYSYINGADTFEGAPLNVGALPLWQQPKGVKELKITKPEHLIEYHKAIASSPDQMSLVVADSQFNIRNVHSLPDDFFDNMTVKKARRELQKITLGSPTANTLFLVMQGDLITEWQRVKKFEKLFVEAVVINPSTGEGDSLRTAFGFGGDRNTPFPSSRSAQLEPGSSDSFEYLRGIAQTVRRRNAQPKKKQTSISESTEEPGSPYIDTKAFKRWFGNSVVVNPDGSPRVVYHGTFNDFDTFEQGDIGFHFGTLEQAQERGDHRRVDTDDTPGLHENLMPVYLQLNNPLRTGDPGMWSEAFVAAGEIKEALEKISEKKLNEFNEHFEEKLENYEAGEKWIFEELRKWLENEGYDGIVYQNEVEGKRKVDDPKTVELEITQSSDDIKGLGKFVATAPSIPGTYLGFGDTKAEAEDHARRLLNVDKFIKDDSYIVFRPTQIKSATGNSGAFDPNDSSIVQEDQGQYDPSPKQANASLPKRVQQSYERMANKVIDGWNERIGWRYGPLGKLPEQRRYLKERYLTLGKVGESQEIAHQVFKSLSGLDLPQQQAVYEYLTTKGAVPSGISNPDVRKAAVKAKRLIDQVGQRLVENGLLSAQAYEAHKDSYLPRIYLKHILGEGRFAQIGSGKRLSDMGYLKSRKDIPEDVRKVILGEITDPAFLASFGLSRTMRDLAIYDFLIAVSENKTWVPARTTVKWAGQNVTPYWLKAEAQSLRNRARFYQSDLRGRAVKIANQMDELADAALDGLGMLKSEDYEQLPNSQRYGVLRGMWVRKEIYADLVGAQNFIPDNASWAEWLLGQGGALTKAQQWWKMSKVALNPPTQVRNFVSNMMLVHLSGVPMRLLVPRVLQAVRSIAKKDQYFKIAEKYGLFSTTFSNQELKRIEDTWIRMHKDLGTGIGALKAIAGELANAASDVYALMEAVGKIAKLRDAMVREGKDEATAMIEAHEALFDYSLIPRSVQYLRNAPIGAPFLTFTYKVLPQVLKTAVKSPLRFLPYMAIPAILNELLQEIWDVDEDDIEKLRKAFPSWMLERGQMLLLPYKDGRGRWQVVDLGYILPWGMVTDTYAALRQGEYVTALENLGVASGPIPSMIAAFKTGRDPFSDREIMNPNDPPLEQFRQLMSYVWNLAMPGLLSPDYGAIVKVIESRDPVDARGQETETFGQAVLRAFGINVYPVTPEESRASNMRYMEYRVSELEGRLRERLSNPNLSEEDREQIRSVYRPLIQAETLRLQQYREDSEVHPNLSTLPAGGQ